MNFELTAIGVIHSPFKEKFGTPRQPGLVSDARFTIELLSPYDKRDALEGIEQFSHLWVSFIFHKNKDQQWSPKVRPPRLGGNKSIGVFASRSPYRPNPIGLSVVEFAGIREENNKLLIDIKGADLVEGTPVLDIKPYIAYSDSVEQAKSGYAQQAPAAKLDVVFSQQAKQQLQHVSEQYPQLENFIRQVIELDPRPAYVGNNEPAKQYGVKLLDFDVQWQVNQGLATIISLEH